MKKGTKPLKKYLYDETLQVISEAHSTLSQSVFDDLVDNFPDIIHSVNEDGLIVSTNKKATELLGYTFHELIGKSITDLYDASLKQQVLAGFQLLKKKGQIGQIESKLRTKKGDLIEVEIRSLSLYDQQGKFVKTFSIIRDIREMIQLRSQIVQQSKMAAIGELSAGIVHDLRNPLTVILSYNNILLRKGIDEKNFELIEKCHVNMAKAATRMERLCSHLRNFSRNEQEEVAQFSVSELIEDCLLMLEGRIKQSGAHIHNLLKENHKIIHSQRNSLEQVLINIIGNACDALKERVSPQITLSADLAEDRLTFRIRDNGHGISEDDLQKIFEAFYTTKPRGEGTGLGLSISMGIIENLGGKIAVQSAINQGTEFQITLPYLYRPQQQTPE